MRKRRTNPDQYEPDYTGLSWSRGVGYGSNETFGV